jgi:hypothetical protein
LMLLVSISSPGSASAKMGFIVLQFSAVSLRNLMVAPAVLLIMHPLHL